MRIVKRDRINGKVPNYKLKNDRNETLKFSKT